MRTTIHLVLFALLASTIFTVYSLSPLSNSVFAAGWLGCRTNGGGNVPGGPGNMSGCTVTYEGNSWDDPRVGVYRYECPGRTVVCYYDYGGDQRDLPEDPPEV